MYLIQTTLLLQTLMKYNLVIERQHTHWSARPTAAQLSTISFQNGYNL